MTTDTLYVENKNKAYRQVSSAEYSTVPDRIYLLVLFTYGTLHRLASERNKGCAI